MPASRRSPVERFRAAWLALTLWSRGGVAGQPGVGLGRLPLRPAIRPLVEFEEPLPVLGKDGARAMLRDRVEQWPHAAPRLALEADTGIGKTTAALARCVAHAVSPWGKGALLFVAHSVGRVREIVALVREGVTRQGGDPEQVADLLGRQPLDAELGQTWQTSRFGCLNPVEQGRAGRRGRRVRAEICDRCPLVEECRTSGYLGHTEQAFQARVIVTTVARVTTLPDPAWKRIGYVIGDEDLMPGLLQEFWVFPSDLRRAATYIARRHERESGRLTTADGRLSARLRDLMGAVTLIQSIAAAIEGFSAREPAALVDLLPAECEPYMTSEGLTALERAMPVLHSRTRWGTRHTIRTELAPAEWECRRAGWTPRQCWGRLLSALRADLGTRDSTRAATVRVVMLAKRRAPARIHVLRFDERTVAQLRRRPILLLDATLHPAISPVLRVEREQIRYRQGRSVVQTFGPLHAEASLRRRSGDRWTLTQAGQQMVARLAAWFAGRTGYVLCRKAMRQPLEAEARRYYELRRAEFITPRYERGWDAKAGTRVLVVLGRYARNGTACDRDHRLGRLGRAPSGRPGPRTARQDRDDHGRLHGRHPAGPEGGG